MRPRSSEHVQRQTVCFPNHDGGKGILQHGDAEFGTELERLYAAAENNALEQLIELKTALRLTSTDGFWAAVTEGMSRILGAELCFVMKRVLVDDQESAVEMPPIGEKGSCIMAAAVHACNQDGTKTTSKSTKFHAWGCPCAYMRHDKVFVVPDRLGAFFNNNPNKLPMPCEAYIAVPLFEEGKCFAHFGAMWSEASAAQRRLSWAFIEMILHSLEDMISQRFLQGANFVQPSSKPAEKNRVIPHEAVTVAQSLRPYAGSLSHELRTPMQGIVGMLDVMYATVLEAVESQADPRIRQVFRNLKDNIEIVQDSSRRAVEAADNVVHAYDMDMSVPEAPPALLEERDEIDSSLPTDTVYGTETLIPGGNIARPRPRKRPRQEDDAEDDVIGSNKSPRLVTCGRCSENDMKQGVQQAELLQNDSTLAASGAASSSEASDLIVSALNASGRVVAPSLRHASLRQLLRFVINEGLKVGGRPDSAIAQPTEGGEIIEVRTRGSDGTIGQKFIHWSIDPGVPHTMFIDEKDLSKLISCVFLNAIKFTGKNDGRIRVMAKMSQRNRYISIKISDNGPGIPAAFLPKLFKPFSQENGSITRSNEGLGLGLMVAKGIARKLGGDLTCTRAETSGVNHGTEFEIKVPLHAGETISRPASPYTSPMLRRANVAGSEQPYTKSAFSMPEGKPPLILPDAASAATLPRSVTAPLPTTPTLPNGGPHLSPASSLPSPPMDSFQQIPLKSVTTPEIDRELASRYPLNFLVAEDNKINRKLLVSMLRKFGYQHVWEAHDGVEAVRQMSLPRQQHEQVDVILMDCWMPNKDGFEAAEEILGMCLARPPTILAVTADATEDALERAVHVGMSAVMTKPFRLLDLQRLIVEYCAPGTTA